MILQPENIKSNQNTAISLSIAIEQIFLYPSVYATNNFGSRFGSLSIAFSFQSMMVSFYILIVVDV